MYLSTVFNLSIFVAYVKKIKKKRTYFANFVCLSIRTQQLEDR